jgi:von Willebrand factor A domain-containing protein 7
MSCAISRWFSVWAALTSTVALCGSVSLAFAQTQPSTNPSRTYGPDACGPADPVYIHTANETGGIPLFLQRSEASKAFHLVRESTRNNVATVFWMTGMLDGNPQSIAIPVDSVTKRITFALSGDTKGSKLKLTQPSGGAVTEGSADTEITELNCGRILTVSSPEAGEWVAEITGTGRFWMEVQAQSDIYFVGVEFLERGGRPGHEGLFRIQGQPVAGTSATLQVSVSARATKSTEFYLFTEQGRAIQKLQMQAVNSDREVLEFVGSVDLPSVPFRVAVIGQDSNGKRYQRFFSNLFHAESVEVSAKLEFDDLPAGSTQRIAFTVRNIGFPRIFNITVTDSHQFVGEVEPKKLTLGAGESGTVRVDLTVPAGTAAGLSEDVVIVAASTLGPPTSNSSVVHWSVSSSQNPR